MSSDMAKYVMMMMQIPPRMRVVLNMRAAKVVRSPSSEKLLRNQWGSVVVELAVLTPAITKKGRSAESVLAFINSACTNVRYPLTPAKAAVNAGMYDVKIALPMIEFTRENIIYDMRNSVDA